MLVNVLGPAAAVLIAALVGACGFHPRGGFAPLADPGRLFLDADRELSIEEPLREALADRSLVLVDDRDAADVVLRVTGERQTQRIVSVRSTGRVSEYELGHAVSMLIRRGDDEPDAAARPDRVEVVREYTYDESRVLGKENEARILRLEMRDALVRQIVLRTVASLSGSDRSRSDPSADAEPG